MLRSRQLKIVQRQALTNQFGAFKKPWIRQFNTKPFFAKNDHKFHQVTRTTSTSTSINYPNVALIAIATIASSILLYTQTTPLLLANDSVITKHAKVIIIQNDDDDYETDDKDSTDPPDFAAEDEIRRKKAIANKPPLNTIFSINDFEYVAQQILPLQLRAYFATDV
ncbi:unnamed protein product [Ambrosiozyma monospora]|uniref:Unnamed protein product n=1 Tax=Ambrosiozyma monospora TaxID=43982 RepID=A0ACB5TAY9_AMBMO|nr:unnamed protein product [Ambrosiozyma monospora]